MGEVGLSTAAIVGIVLGCGALVAVATVIICVILSASRRKKRKFNHAFRATIKVDKQATLMNLNRNSKKAGKDVSNKLNIQVVECPPEPRYVSLTPQNTRPVNQLVTPSFSGHQQYPMGYSQSPGSDGADHQQLSTSPQKNTKDRRSPIFLRPNRSPKPLPKIIYTKVPTRGSSLYRPNSDCVSVISCDLGDPRNSPLMKRHSSLYMPVYGLRPRAETASTTRSSTVAMDLGDETHKAWMMLDIDNARGNSNL